MIPIASDSSQLYYLLSDVPSSKLRVRVLNSIATRLIDWQNIRNQDRCANAELIRETAMKAFKVMRKIVEHNQPYLIEQNTPDEVWDRIEQQDPYSLPVEWKLFLDALDATGCARMYTSEDQCCGSVYELGWIWNGQDPDHLEPLGKDRSIEESLDHLLNCPVDDVATLIAVKQQAVRDRYEELKGARAEGGHTKEEIIALEEALGEAIEECDRWSPEPGLPFVR